MESVQYFSGESRRSSSGEFLLHAPCWNLSLTHPHPHLPRSGMRLFIGLGVSPTRPVLKSVSSFGTWGVSLKRPVLDCLLIRQLGSLSYTARTTKCLIVRRMGESVLHGPHLILSHCSSGEKSLTGPVMESV